MVGPQTTKKAASWRTQALNHTAMNPTHHTISTETLQEGLMIRTDASRRMMDFESRVHTNGHCTTNTGKRITETLWILFPRVVSCGDRIDRRQRAISKIRRSLPHALLPIRQSSSPVFHPLMGRRCSRPYSSSMLQLLLFSSTLSMDCARNGFLSTRSP